ncbi:alpha/beta hydrolase [Paenalkalicoccus suaedae]|uniref:Alpha/beta hydrolase n=1 Tax=Paenalkalicoccus suaedae TaxID=2592382 RepID=A0A859FDK7_9BACI|nr:alpha/beta hydrolase [Paenalkalicoccus suaedae]QKS71167.1 alpha/beta hydrolase [Paenalkalicoccus suaedae]
MMKRRGFIRRFIFVTSFLSALSVAIVSMTLFIWQQTDEGRLPAKTAVVLHAINNNLVSLDINIRPPKIVTGESGSPSLLREDITIPVQGGSQIPARIYRPSGDGPHPIVIYYHGGAFLEGFGDLDTHNNIIRSLASRTNSIVIAPSYRVAPEYVFPTATEDSYSTLLWAQDNAASLKGDPSKISVAGDSAGGNLATVVSMMSRDRNGPSIASQVLLYPLTTFQDIPLASREAYDSGYYLLSRSVMYKARDSYTPDEWMWNHSYTSPLQADNLEDLPPALIVTAEFDPLRDEGEQYATRLHEAGVPVKATRYRGVMHGFVSFYEVMQSGRDGLQEASVFLRQVNNETLRIRDEYALQVKEPPKGFDKVRDHTEAFAIAAYLLGKSGADFLIVE